jgi:hypothetical protein
MGTEAVSLRREGGVNPRLAREAREGGGKRAGSRRDYEASAFGILHLGVGQDAVPDAAVEEFLDSWLLMP